MWIADITLWGFEEVASGEWKKERGTAQWSRRKRDSSTARPDAPDCGAEEKIGPLRSE